MLSAATSNASGPTAYSRSHEHAAGARLVTSTCSKANRSQRIAHERRRVEHVFEIVEHQQRRSILASDAEAPGQISGGDVA